jgi:hypothetical protein
MKPFQLPTLSNQYFVSSSIYKKVLQEFFVHFQVFYANKKQQKLRMQILYNGLPKFLGFGKIIP